MSVRDQSAQRSRRLADRIVAANFPISRRMNTDRNAVLAPANSSFSEPTFGDRHDLERYTSTADEYPPPAAFSQQSATFTFGDINSTDSYERPSSLEQNHEAYDPENWQPLPVETSAHPARLVNYSSSDEESQTRGVDLIMEDQAIESLANSLSTVDMQSDVFDGDDENDPHDDTLLAINVGDHEMINVSADTGFEATIFRAQAAVSTDTDLLEAAANTDISTTAANQDLPAEPEAEGRTVNDISFYDTDEENADRTLEILAAELPFGEDPTDEFGERTNNWEGASAVPEEEPTGVDPEVYDNQGYVIYRNPLPPPADETDIRLHPRALRELFSQRVSVRAKYVAYFRRRTGLARPRLYPMIFEMLPDGTGFRSSLRTRINVLGRQWVNAYKHHQLPIIYRQRGGYRAKTVALTNPKRNKGKFARRVHNEIHELSRPARSILTADVASGVSITRQMPLPPNAIAAATAPYALPPIPPSHGMSAYGGPSPHDPNPVTAASFEADMRSTRALARDLASNPNATASGSAEATSSISTLTGSLVARAGKRGHIATTASSPAAIGASSTGEASSAAPAPAAPVASGASRTQLNSSTTTLTPEVLASVRSMTSIALGLIEARPTPTDAGPVAAAMIAKLKHDLTKVKVEWRLWKGEAQRAQQVLHGDYIKEKNLRRAREMEIARMLAALQEAEALNDTENEGSGDVDPQGEEEDENAD
ncbi:hypothetical protein BJX65DRAFT_301449 [Aspergillus insuetus]